MEAIDGHIHLSLFPEGKLEGYLKAAHDRGITGFLQGGYSPTDWQNQLELKKQLGSRLAVCFGLHPWYVADTDENRLDRDLEILKNEIHNADLLGEAGIDRFYKSESDTRQKQMKYFGLQLDLADEIKKPVVFHVVRAYGEALDFLKARKRDYRGLMHSYAGSLESAREYKKLGIYISVGPGILLQGFHKLKQTVEGLNVEDFIIESDAPHAGHPDEGQNLNVELVFNIAKAIATIKGATVEKVLECSNRNILSLLKN